MKKVVLISLADNCCNNLGENVAEKLGMYFLNIDDLIEYSLLDSAKMLKICGKEHYIKQEKNVLAECFDYVNTLYCVSYEVYVNNLDSFANKKIVYIALSLKELEKLNEKNFVINSIAFVDRDDFLRKMCYTIDYQNINEQTLVEKITECIMGEK